MQSVLGWAHFSLGSRAPRLEVQVESSEGAASTFYLLSGLQAVSSQPTFSSVEGSYTGIGALRGAALYIAGDIQFRGPGCTQPGL